MVVLRYFVLLILTTNGSIDSQIVLSSNSWDDVINRCLVECNRGLKYTSFVFHSVLVMLGVVSCLKQIVHNDIAAGNLRVAFSNSFSVCSSNVLSVVLYDLRRFLCILACVFDKAVEIIVVSGANDPWWYDCFRGVVDVTCVIWKLLNYVNI